MLYTSCVFLLGVYVGQEYKYLPSIKLLFLTSLEYLKQPQQPLQSQYDFEALKRGVKDLFLKRNKN